MVGADNRSVPYSVLDEGRILATIERLHERIRERFPAAGLTAVAQELVAVGKQHAARSQAILRPNWGLRAVSVVLLLLGVVALALVFTSVRRYEPENMHLFDLLQALESGLSMLFLLAAGAVLLTGHQQELPATLGARVLALRGGHLVSEA